MSHLTIFQETLQLQTHIIVLSSLRCSLPQLFAMMSVQFASTTANAQSHPKKPHVSSSWPEMKASDPNYTIIREPSWTNLFSTHKPKRKVLWTNNHQIHYRSFNALSAWLKCMTHTHLTLPATIGAKLLLRAPQWKMEPRQDLHTVR